MTKTADIDACHIILDAAGVPLAPTISERLVLGAQDFLDRKAPGSEHLPPGCQDHLSIKCRKAVVAHREHFQTPK